MSRKSGGHSPRILGLSGWQIGLLVILTILLCLGVAAALLFVVGFFNGPPAPDVPGEPATPTIEVVEDTPSPTDSAQQTSQGPTDIPPSPVTETQSPTSTVFTKTPTVQFTTPTPTTTLPVDVCTTLDLRFLSATSNIAAWRLQNDSGTTLTFSRIEIDWPQSNDAIFNVFVNGMVIWSDEDLTPPTVINSWIGSPDDRSVDRLSRVEFFFGTLAAPGGYDLNLWFENGCVISAAN